MSNCIANAHLQIEREEFAFVAVANALHPRGDDGSVALPVDIHEQKEHAKLCNFDALPEILALERVVHQELVVVALQTVLQLEKNTIRTKKILLVSR